ncbi:MAG TPA: DUF6602 domain-containing protein [Thermodesulfobacteriota bacterium]|nr:DUF6602 domain-containing protein [Thermodesulfobacteriota bacterium]
MFYLEDFFFNFTGHESKQIDVIVTNDVCPQYNLTNPNGQGKTFACIEGALAVASIKSNLDSKELIDSLENLASLPQKAKLGNRAIPLLNISEANYDDWPFKIIYASSGVSIDTLLDTINEFYTKNPSIPTTQQPNLIHVAGKYNVVRIPTGGVKTRDGTAIPENTFYQQSDTTDVYALAYAIQKIQEYALLSRYILFHYDEILENMPF